MPPHHETGRTSHAPKRRATAPAAKVTGTVPSGSSVSRDAEGAGRWQRPGAFSRYARATASSDATGRPVTAMPESTSRVPSRTTGTPTAPRLALLDPVTAAEFRGLFFGEGHIDLMRSGACTGVLYPRVRIAVRDDDRAVVEWCQSLFGGSLTKDARTRSVCWQATGRERITVILAALTGGGIPSKKRAEVELLREAVALVRPQGHRPSATDKVRMLEIRDELKALRQYKPAEVAA